MAQESAVAVDKAGGEGAVVRRTAEGQRRRSAAEVDRAGYDDEVVPKTEGQQHKSAAAVGKTRGGNEVVPRTEGQQQKAAACRRNGDGLVDEQHLLARSAGLGMTARDSGPDGLVEEPLLVTAEELHMHASEADADGDAKHARHLAVTESGGAENSF